MRKRLLALTMAGIMAVSMTACGGSQTAKSDAPTTAAEAAATSAAPAGTGAAEDSGQGEAAPAGEVTAASFVPSKDFNIRVPFAAGGTMDTVARIIGQGLQKTYGKSVVINNLTGANGAIAAADLDGAKTDATEIMAGGIAMFTLAPLFNKDVNMKLEDYQFVSGLVTEDIMLFTAPSLSGIKDWEGLQEYAKTNRIVYGSNAPGGTTHLVATMLFGEAGIDAEAVTSDGSAKDLLALAGGNVVCALATSSLGAQYVEEGSLVPIVVFSNEPYTGYEGITVPTAKSLGYDIVFQTCNFLMTKKDVNPADVAAIHQAILDYSETDEFKELAANASYIPDLSDGETIRQAIADAAAMCQKAYDTYYAK